MTTVDVYYFNIGERWFGTRFRVPNKYEIPLQVYGETELILETNLKRVLDFEFGEGKYLINKVEDPVGIDA